MQLTLSETCFSQYSSSVFWSCMMRSNKLWQCMCIHVCMSTWREQWESSFRRLELVLLCLHYSNGSIPCFLFVVTKITSIPYYLSCVILKIRNTEFSPYPRQSAFETRSAVYEVWRKILKALLWLHEKLCLILPNTAWFLLMWAHLNTKIGCSTCSYTSLEEDGNI